MAKTSSPAELTKKIKLNPTKWKAWGGGSKIYMTFMQFVIAYRNSDNRKIGLGKQQYLDIFASCPIVINEYFS